MPPAQHQEQHFMASDIVRDIVIGMSDGLTVPFAIAAGMSGAAVVATIVVTAGLAEIAAGSISMGLGGYLAGRTDVEHYETERKREIRETEEVPKEEARKSPIPGGPCKAPSPSPCPMPYRALFHWAPTS